MSERKLRLSTDPKAEGALLMGDNPESSESPESTIWIAGYVYTEDGERVWLTLKVSVPQMARLVWNFFRPILWVKDTYQRTIHGKFLIRILKKRWAVMTDQRLIPECCEEFSSERSVAEKYCREVTGTTAA